MSVEGKRSTELKRKFWLANPHLQLDTLIAAAKDSGFEVVGTAKRKYFVNSNGDQHFIRIKDGCVIGYDAADNNVLEFAKFLEEKLGCNSVLHKSQIRPELDIPKYQFEPADNSAPALDIEFDGTGIDEYEHLDLRNLKHRGDDIYRLAIALKLSKSEYGLTEHEIDKIVVRCVDGELDSQPKLSAVVREAVDKSPNDVRDEIIKLYEKWHWVEFYPDMKKFADLIFKGLEEEDNDFITQASAILHKKEIADTHAIPMFIEPIKEMLPRLYKVHFKIFEK